MLRGPGRDVAFVGGIDLCHGRRDDATPPRRPAVAADGRRSTATHPPWHDVQLEMRGPAVAALDTTFRQRWNDPRSVDTDNPLSRLKDRLRHADISPDPLPPQPPVPDRRAGRAPCRCCAPTPRSGRAPLRPARRAHGGPRVRQGAAAGAAAGVPRGPVPVVRRTSPGCSPRPCAPNPELHMVVVVPRHPDVDGRFALPPNQVGRVQAIATCREGAPDRVHVYDLENDARHTGLRARQGLRGRRRVGRARAAPTSTGARGATTASCRSRCWTTRGTTRDPATGGARRRRPPLRPRPAAAAACASTSTAPTATTRTCSTRTTRWRAVTAAAATRSTPGTPAAGSARGRPGGCARTTPSSCRPWTRVWAAPPTGSSTTRTAGRSATGCRKRW